MSKEQTQVDDPSGPGWREVGPDEVLQVGDMFWRIDRWEATQNAGTKSYRYGTGYRRRIEQQQPSNSKPSNSKPSNSKPSNSKPSNSKPSNSKPSNSKPKTVHDLRRRLAECEVLLAEADRSGQQVNAELQQLREQLATSQHLAEMSRRQVAGEASKIEQLKEQVQTLTRERDRYRNQLAGAIEPQTQPTTDDPSGPGWRDVTTGGVTQDGDMVRADDEFPLGRWVAAEPGETVTDDDVVRRRIGQQSAPDDPSGPGWRDLGPDEVIAQGDVRWSRMDYTLGGWVPAKAFGDTPRMRCGAYRRRIEQPNAELQQLRERVRALTLERERYRNQLSGALDRLQTWLRPVLEVVADHPDDSSILAVSVLEFLPQIASRLIEE